MRERALAPSAAALPLFCGHCDSDRAGASSDTEGDAASAANDDGGGGADVVVGRCDCWLRIASTEDASATAAQDRIALCHTNARLKP